MFDTARGGNARAAYEKGCVVFVAIRINNFADTGGFEVEIYLEMEDGLGIQFRDEVHKDMLPTLNDAKDRHAAPF
jgi:hypothetical protein